MTAIIAGMRCSAAVLRARKGREAMRLAARRRHAALALVALVALTLAACAPGADPNSPQVDETYRRMYGPIIDGG